MYIVALTPIACLSDIRRDLQKVTIASLLAQTSTNWQALLVGEVEREEVQHGAPSPDRASTIILPHLSVA